MSSCFEDLLLAPSLIVKWITSVSTLPIVKLGLGILANQSQM